MTTQDPKRLLVVDDEANMRHMLTQILERSGYAVDTAEDGAEAMSRVRERRYDFILCDIRMPKMDGMAFLDAARPLLAKTTVIVMSAYGTIDTALEAMKRGAYDYISKPFKPDEVFLVLKKAEERERLQTENRKLRDRLRQIAERERFGKMIGASPAMQRVFRLAEKLAPFTAIVLITGESGTGKELIARGIHREGPRAEKPWVPVNCGGIPETLMESELFGHKKGAFTGADRDAPGLFREADGGTLFLDEVGELPMALQVKLLRVLQEGEVRPVGGTRSTRFDVRVIAATAKDLEAEVAQGRFREDLFYRLNVMPLHLPPLRERTEDIPLLGQFFIRRYNRKFGTRVEGIAPAAMARMIAYDWPGNVRELENVIQRAVVMADGPIIDLDAFPDAFAPAGKSPGLSPSVEGDSLKAAQGQLEQIMIRRALEKTKGNRSQAARLLEISHPSLLSKIKRYGLGDIS